MGPKEYKIEIYYPELKRWFAVAWSNSIEELFKQIEISPTRARIKNYYSKKIVYDYAFGISL